MGDRMGALESVVHLMNPDNASLNLKTRYWETASKAVTCGFGLWVNLHGKGGGAYVVLGSEKAKLLLERSSLGLT